MKKITYALLILSISVSSITCRAAQVEYNFTASIESMFEYNGPSGAIKVVKDSVFPGARIANGDVINGQFYFDTSTTKSPYYQPTPSATGTWQIYSQTGVNQAIDFSIGKTGVGFHSSVGNDGFSLIQVANNSSSLSGMDMFYVGGWAAYSPLTFQSASLIFLDSTGTAFGDSAIPKTLNLKNFDYATLSSAWLRKSDGSQWHMTADITSLTQVVVTAVPEPETYAMLLAGLGLIGSIARRRKAKQV